MRDDGAGRDARLRDLVRVFPAVLFVVFFVILFESSPNPVRNLLRDLLRVFPAVLFVISIVILVALSAARERDSTMRVGEMAAARSEIAEDTQRIPKKSSTEIANRITNKITNRIRRRDRPRLRRRLRTRPGRGRRPPDASPRAFSLARLRRRGIEQIGH